MQRLDSLLESSAASEVGAGDTVKDIEAQIKAREEKLAPLYTQIACEFADLHDRAGRMEAKGVIRKGLEWRRARGFFFFRVRRRLLEQSAVNRLQAADASLSADDAKKLVATWMPEEDDKAAVAAYDAAEVDAKIEGVRVQALKRTLQELYNQLPEGERAGALG